MNGEERVVIVGAGWAGVAAALELHRHRIPVTLLESAKQPGGRARSVTIDGMTFDNGQHLLIGAYHETLRLLTQIGVEENRVLARQPLRLDVHDKQRDLGIKAPPLPAPLHLVGGLLSATGLTMTEKYYALRMSLLLRLKQFRIQSDTSVAELLRRYRQGADITRRFWEPLCLATLNTPIHRASARVFLRVLQDSFSKHRRDADLLIPRVPLGELFCEAAARYLGEDEENRLELSQRVIELSVDNGKVTGVLTGKAQTHAGDIILATGPVAAARLLSTLPAMQPQAKNIAQLGEQPIITVYLNYPSCNRLTPPMQGLSGTVAQWVFDRAVCGQPDWYAVVVSAEGKHNNWDNEHLVRHIQEELAACLPEWPKTAEKSLVIREKRATFDCRVDIDALRPGNRTAVPGLWLAGDYTDTGYPATLEGAVRSGVQCAHEIITQRHTRH